MRNPKPIMLAMLLSLAAPGTIAHAAAPARGATRALRAPKAPRAPAAPRAPEAPEAPMPPEPPMPPDGPPGLAPMPPMPPGAPEAPMGWVMHMGQPKARLGTQVSTMTSELRTFFGAKEDVGLLVQHIEPGSAAEAAKVRVGDVLVEVDGQRIVNVSDVRDALADRSKGDVVDVVVIRGKKRKTLKATLTTEAGPTAFTMPPGLDHDFEIPPEARRFMSPEAQADLERELDQVREELREVERQLGELHGPGGMVAPEAPTPPPPPAKGKRTKKQPR